MEHKVPADGSIRELNISRPQEEEEQEATPRLGGQRRIARMVFPECLTKSLGNLEGRWNYTPPHTGCARLWAVTHSSEECNLCACLQNTSTLFWTPGEGAVPPPSHIQFPIKVNTVWKCSHSRAQYDGSWVEFYGLIKERLWELSLSSAPALTWYCTWALMVHGRKRSTHGAEGTPKIYIYKSNKANTNVYLTVAVILRTRGILLCAALCGDCVRCTEVQKYSCKIYIFLNSFHKRNQGEWLVVQELFSP